MIVLIELGARFPPCMRNVTTMPPTDRYVCMNGTINTDLGLLNPAVDLTDPGGTCSLADICGMGGFQNPNQSFRFLTSLFLHTGIIQLLIHILIHLVLCVRIERAMNAIRFSGLYLSAGVFGNIFGANFASPTTHKVLSSRSILNNDIEESTIFNMALSWKAKDI
ncbi:hypothetical protein DFQ30_009138 [Apophysomyces sp. BC1015]|nr:hypothetical protein DFQ30_009138 [Apophysomyces sp. BC1015]